MALGTSGAGSEVTALAESLQAYVCAARQHKGSDIANIYEVTDNTTRDADCDRPLKRCLDELNDEWKYSCITTANQMFKDMKLNGYMFTRGSKIEDAVYSEFRKFKKDSGLSGEDKWNPADIWVVKKNFKVKTGFKGLNELNAFIYDCFKKKDLIGVSLKKVPKGKAHATIFNDGNPPNAKFKGVKIGKDIASSKDAYIEFSFDGKDGMIQLRNFSSRPVPSSWQGEIKGKSAAGGKIGGGILIEAALDSGVPKKDIMKPSDFKSKIENPSEDDIKQLAAMFKIVSGSPDSVDTIYKQASNQAAKDKTWWMSKYLSVAYCYAITKNKKGDAVAKWIYGYGSSATKNSSIFVKYSD